MDAIALFASGTAAPTDAAPPTGGAPGDAFAAVFAAAMDGAPAIQLSEGELPLVAVVSAGAADSPTLPPECPSPLDPLLPPPCPMPPASPRSAPAAGLQARETTAVPVIEASSDDVPAAPFVGRPTPLPPTVVETPAPEVSSTEAPVDEAAPADEKARPVRATGGRARARAESPPESPPRATAPAAPEKEAPTTAPNAPVPPLDRSSALPDEEEESRIGQPTAAVAAAPVVVPRSPGSVPARPRKSQEAPTKVGPTDALPARAVASMPAPILREPVGDAGFVPATASESEASEQTLLAAPDLDAVPFVVSRPLTDGFVPVLGEGDPGSVNHTFGGEGASATRQIEADAAPVAVAVAKSPLASTPAQAPVPNEQVARVAAERTPALVPLPLEKPAPKIGETEALDPKAAILEIETAVLQGEATRGDDAPPDDAPHQPSIPAEAAPVARTNATERPDAGVDRSSVDRHLVVRQVADRIESLVAARPRDGVTVHLEPRDLGTITLVVKGLRSALDVQVTASDERVRQSLDTSRPELAQALAPRGIELREMRVAIAPPTADGATGANAGSGGRPSPEGQARQQAPVFVKPSRTEARASRATRSSGRGVDLLV